jgi:hypothetical protein
MINLEYKNLLIECLNTNILLEQQYGGGSGSGVDSKGRTSFDPNASSEEDENEKEPSREEDERERKSLMDIPFGEMSQGDIAASAGMYGGGKILDMLQLQGRWSPKLGKYIGGSTKGLRSGLGKLAGSVVANAFADLRKLTGQDWVDAQVKNLVSNQESMRREGLGHTTGWAKLFLTPRTVDKYKE